MASLRRKLIQLMSLKKESGGGGGLPDEYQQVEYIESHGGYPSSTKQYINSNYTPNENTGYEVEYMTQGTNTSYESIMGTISLSEGVEKWFGIEYNWEKKDSLTVMLSGSGKIFIPAIRNQKHHFTMDKNGNYNLDGNTGHLGSFTSLINTPIFIFAMRDTSAQPFRPSTCKLYKLKFYENDVLVRNFVPCYRKSDGEIGMFETVNQVFYTNQGTGIFTKGADVII